uniref:Ubiquitin-like domain-containing protein n=1 Tax=Ananas comosus var. bracteatus TaxID=296719 RepID=A0A6V7NY81_ANACO|nr:unnamed protein product [Ananas comosus var. bracteatus]
MDCEEEEVAAGCFSELYVDGGMKIFVRGDRHPNTQIWLLFDGLVMGEEKTLAECGVQDRSLLHCIQALRGGGDGGMEILVRAAKIGEISMTYKVDDSDKVLDVMVKIAEAISIPIHQIRLIFHDLVMERGENFGRMRCSGRVLPLLDQALCGGGDGGMEIFVRAITISEIGMTFKVDGSDKVWDVMVKIEEAIGIPIHQISLLFDGRKMGEETTLAEWGVEDGPSSTASASYAVAAAASMSSSSLAPPNIARSGKRCSDRNSRGSGRAGRRFSALYDTSTSSRTLASTAVEWEEDGQLLPPIRTPQRSAVSRQRAPPPTPTSASPHCCCGASPAPTLAPTPRDPRTAPLPRVALALRPAPPRPETALPSSSSSSSSGAFAAELLDP